jgi:TonB family protein
MNRHRRAPIALVVFFCAAAGAFAADRLELAVTTDGVLNARAGSESLQITLTPQGAPGSRVGAGRVIILDARDDAGRELGHDAHPAFHHDSAGGGDDSYDLSAVEPIAFTLGPLPAGIRSLSSVEGRIELVIPDLDPDALASADHLPSRFGIPIKSQALEKAGVTLTVFDSASAKAAVDAGAPGGPQEYDTGPLFGMPAPGTPSWAARRVPGSQPFEMGENDVAVCLSDPRGSVVGIEFRTHDNKPIRYRHNGSYHSSLPPGHPERRFDIYRMPSRLPDDAVLVCWLATDKSVVSAPFHLDDFALPGAPANPLASPVTPRTWVVGVDLPEPAGAAAVSAAYLAAHGDGATARKATSAEDDAMLSLWSDRPEYVAMIKGDLRYRKNPRLVSAVTPRFPPVVLPVGTQIEVLVSFVVAADGSVADARALKSDDARFDRPAVESVLKWKFAPAETDAGPARIFVQVPVRFVAPDPSKAAAGTP